MMKYILLMCIALTACTSKDEAVEQAYRMIKREQQWKADCQELAKCLGLYAEAVSEYNNDYDRKVVLKCRLYRSQIEKHYGQVQIYFDDKTGEIRKASIVCSMKGSHDETCKLPRSSKPKASPSPSSH
jgi:hypothetical protein